MRRLTNVNVNQSDPTWSPDSKLIAVARGGTGSPIVIVDVATGEDLVQLGVNGAANRWPDWR
jgi:Tol biopolymer transport system component